MEPTDLIARTSIHKLGEVNLSQEILALADVNGFVQKMQSLSTNLDRVNTQMGELTNAPWYKKLWFQLTGKTGKTQEEAMQMYGEVLQAVLQLSALNTIFAKRISDQQKTVENLSRQIVEQGQVQDQQDKKHEKALGEIKQKQTEILRLVDDQNKIFNLIPELKDGLDGLHQKFQEHDELLKNQTKQMGELSDKIDENRGRHDKEQGLRLKLEKKVNLVLAGLLVFVLITLAVFVFLTPHFH